VKNKPGMIFMNHRLAVQESQIVSFDKTGNTNHKEEEVPKFKSKDTPDTKSSSVEVPQSI